MTQAPANLGSRAGQPWCEGERPANNAHDVHGTKGLFFTQSMRGHLPQLLFRPTDNGRKTFICAGVPPRLLSSSPRQGLRGLGSAPTWAFRSLLKKNKPCAKERLVAAGDFPHESVSLSLGRPGRAVPRGVSRGRASPHPARRLAAPSAAPADPRGSAPRHTLEAVAWSARSPFCPVLT